MTTQSVTIDNDGNMAYSTTQDANKVVRDTDYNAPGVTVQDGFGLRTVTEPDQLRGDEILQVQGMEMSVTQARELGLLNQVFDDSLSVAAAAKANTPQHQEAVKPVTGHEDYDQVASDISERVEAGDLSEDEAFEFDLAATSIAAANLTVTEVVDIIDGLNDGSLSELDVDAESRQVAQSVEQRVTQTATKSAYKELGQQGFERLSQLAAASPVIDRAISQYASMRALGRSTDSWSDFLSMAEDEMAGRA